MARVHEHHAAGDAPLVDGYAPFCKHVFVPNFVGAPVSCLTITDANRHLVGTKKGALGKAGRGRVVGGWTPRSPANPAANPAARGRALTHPPRTCALDDPPTPSLSPTLQLRTGYTRRRPEELAVLARWFLEADVGPLPRAAFLDVILYSREQVEAEKQAMPGKGGGEASPPPTAPWAIISVKAQAEGHETPMLPITAMRNALGREEGGSGVPLDREAYEAATAYWADKAPVFRTDPETV